MCEWQRITFGISPHLTTGPPFCSWVHTILKASWLARPWKVSCLCLHLSRQPRQWQCILLHLASQGFWGFKLRSVDLHKSLTHCTPPSLFLSLPLPLQTLTVLCFWKWVFSLLALQRRGCHKQRAHWYSVLSCWQLLCLCSDLSLILVHS